MSDTVVVDKDNFIDWCWDRVNERYSDYFSDEFWEECFDYLAEDGFLSKPQYNDPAYIVDNIAINGEIVAKEDCSSDDYFPEINNAIYKGDVDKWIDNNGYLVFGDYVVINLGL